MNCPALICCFMKQETSFPKSRKARCQPEQYGGLSSCHGAWVSSCLHLITANGSCSACWASEESGGLRGGSLHPRSPTSQQLARFPPSVQAAIPCPSGAGGCQGLSVTCLSGWEWWVGWEPIPGFKGLLSGWWTELAVGRGRLVGPKLPRDGGPPPGLWVLAPNHPR